MNIIGVIGGSGLYEMEGLEDLNEELVHTPFGEPSDSYISGKLGDDRVIFLPRHGRGHRHLPNEVNYAANIWGMKALGVQRLISITAVGSLKEQLAPTDVVLPDQYFDRMLGNRRSTFFGDGCVAHVSMAEPSCPVLRNALLDAARKVGAKVHEGGTYINMEGPAFSTRAESMVYRQWGMDVIGMTNIAEARLAREAEICYQSVAMVTDYDCWHEAHDNVSVEMVIENLQQNVVTAKKIIRSVLAFIPVSRDCACVHGLKDAIMTSPDAIPPETRRRLNLIIEKYL